MSSTRSIVIVLAVAALSAVGCQRAATTATPDQSVAITADDPIQQTRADWPKSTSYFANGDVVAGPTGTVYEPTGCPRRQSASDVPTFLGNTLLLPWTLSTSPRSQTHTGAQFEPTYTAVPPER